MKFFVLPIILCFNLSARAELVERVVAVVNNEIVLETDLSAFAKKLEQNGFIDDLLLLGNSVDNLKKARELRLEYLINEKILDSEIKRLNLSVTVERVEQEIRDIAKKNGVSRTEMMASLKSQGIGASEYQDFVKSRIERQSLIEGEITSKIRVTDEDIMAQYVRLHPESSAGVYEYTLSHILFNPKKGGPEAALERAQVALKKIRSGESFEVVAEQHSEDSNFASGGALGTFKAGEFAKEMEEAVSNLSAGETSGIVKSRAGYHILKVVSKKIVADSRYEKEKEKIRASLFEKSFQKHFKNWLEMKREESFVKINKS
ncbi:MAG: peptidylprolyl isomerase [Oligoflexia bacterium]|nr:MAG: peptidylprolyl isomerase [Oligoflexia bacterium]